MRKDEEEYYRSKWGKDKWPPIPAELRDSVQVPAKKKESVLHKIWKYLEWKPSTEDIKEEI